MQVVNIQNVMVCLAVSIQYVCVTDGQTDILRRALVIYRRRRFINHLLTYLLTYIVRTMHTRRAVKTAQNLSVSHSNCFSSDKMATLTQRLMYHGSSVVSRKPLCH